VTAERPLAARRDRDESTAPAGKAVHIGPLFPLGSRRSPKSGRLLALLCASVLACCSPALWAQTPWSALGEADRETLAPLAEKWEQLSPERQQQLLKGAQRWRDMPAEERSQAQQRFKEWQALPPERKQALRERYERFKQLPPEQQRRVREEFQRFRELPPEERQALKERFKNMSPEERRQQREALRNGARPGAGGDGESQARREALRERRDQASPEEWQRMREQRDKFLNASPEERQQWRERRQNARDGGGPSGAERPGRDSRRASEPNRRWQGMQNSRGGPGQRPAR
jgi:hypothetical protein